MVVAIAPFDAFWSRISAPACDLPFTVTLLRLTWALSLCEITLTLGWGTVTRLDLVPASCADPDCDADHGYEGTVASDDISLRISAEAEGDDALQHALDFARELSASIGR